MALRRDLVEAEIERLHALGAELERDFRRIPWLGVFVLAAIPAYLVWGTTAAVYALLAVPCLVITAYYLIGVRRAENRQNIEELERQRDRAK